MTKNDIYYLCIKYNIKKYTINDDMSIDVNGAVNLWNKNFYEFPLSFGKVSGMFECSSNRLTTLKGGPYYVGGGFYCSNLGYLRSLDHCPTYIGGDFAWWSKPSLVSRYLLPNVGGKIFSDCYWKF